MTQWCQVCFGSQISLARGRNNALGLSLHTIERYALDKEGVIGSLYNARTDNLLTRLPLSKDLLSQKEVKETPICKLKRANNGYRDNMLERIGIQDGLRINITLNISPVSEGTIMLHTYVPPTDCIVRLIDYSRIDQEECLFNDIQMVRQSLPDSPPNNNATHIITSIQRGIDFVIVLEFPTTTNIKDTDLILERVCEYFTKPEASFLSEEDQQTINCLKPTIFTSIPDIDSFAKNKELSVTCKDIHHYIHQSRNSYPLSYTLHPLKCIYYEKLSSEKIYHELSHFNVWTIEDSQLKLSKRLKIIERLFQEMLSQLSKSDERFTEEVDRDLCIARKMHYEFQQTLKEKIIELRQVDPLQTLLYDELDNTRLKTLDSKLSALQTTLIEFQRKTFYTKSIIRDSQASDSSATDSHLKSSDQRYLKNTTTQSQVSNSSQRFAAIVKPKEINILLIGETGVGKSTFINAFVNYLAFHSFEKAENGDPIVLIPVSFLITIGDQFEDKQIKFGQTDSNEDHNNVGQSVTQYCKSYIFKIRNNIKLRIIDTPGIGDTRGTEQDKKNIEHILSYTSNLPHLNAICFLLKSNATRLHALFRSCFTQLFNFLGTEARENIIFCFTNARATFYAPGDTAKQLKTMLNELPHEHIPYFVKENTFCFDSESFRYLAVIKAERKLPFNDHDKTDFQQSWKISVKESARLLDYIELRPKYQMSKWRSMEHAQMTIKLLVRPICETVRNILQNLILLEPNCDTRLIELQADPIPLPAWLCIKSPYEIRRIGDTSIVIHSLQNDRTSNRCSICGDILDAHLSVLYNLDYRLVDTKNKRISTELETMKNRLLQGSVILSKFLLHVDGTSPNPFLTWFDFFIKEQVYICSQERSNDFSDKLSGRLHEEKEKYVSNLEGEQFDGEHIQLDDVYNCIDEILVYPTILEQMTAIKASQIETMEKNEHDVSFQYPDIDSFL